MPESGSPTSRWREVLRVLERALAITGVFFIVFHGGFGLSEMTSPSMAPTLYGDGADPNNDWILYVRLSTRLTAPPRRKLIVFRSEDGLLIAKRVMGFSRERLRIEDGDLVVDGEVSPVDGVRYLRAGRLRPRQDGGSIQVAEDALFVLGDNSKDSWDSRFFGDLREDQWRGRVVAVVWPPSRWSWQW